MFDPAKLSPLPLRVIPASFGVFAFVEIDNGDVIIKSSYTDDAKFFVMARRCYDIGERRGWHLKSVPAGRSPWTVEFYDDLESVSDDHRAFVPSQAEAMALMIEADEWLTKQETSEGNSDEC